MTKRSNVINVGKKCLAVSLSLTMGVTAFSSIPVFANEQIPVENSDKELFDGELSESSVKDDLNSDYNEFVIYDNVNNKYYNLLEEALTQAKAVIDDPEATQSQVDEADYLLNARYWGVLLQDLIDKYNPDVFDYSKYTTDSANKVKDEYDKNKDWTPGDGSMLDAAMTKLAYESFEIASRGLVENPTLEGQSKVTTIEDNGTEVVVELDRPISKSNSANWTYYEEDGHYYVKNSDCVGEQYVRLITKDQDGLTTTHCLYRPEGGTFSLISEFRYNDGTVESPVAELKVGEKTYEVRKTEKVEVSEILTKAPKLIVRGYDLKEASYMLTQSGTKRQYFKPVGDHTSIEMELVNPNTGLPQTGKYTLTGVSNATKAQNQGTITYTYVAVDRSELDAKIAEAKALNATDFTEETWAVLEEKLVEAQAVSDSNISTQVEVDQALENLQEALSNLKEVAIFTDISSDDWFYDSVKYVNDNGLMTGLNETTFGPYENLARAQFAVILHRISGSPEIEYTDKFPDVADGQWYTDAILWANEAGVVGGYTDTGKFGPGDNINREQMAVMMYRYAEYLGYDTSARADISQYADAKNVNEFAREAMSWAVGSGIITGKENGTKLDPQGNASRAECATIIMRFKTNYSK